MKPYVIAEIGCNHMGNIEIAKEIEVVDYEGNKHLVKLDPKLSIKQNANKYYRNYIEVFFV